MKAAARFAEEAYQNARDAKHLTIKHKQKDLTEDYEYREASALNHWLYHLTWLYKNDSTDEKQTTLLYELLGQLDQFRTKIRTWKDWYNYEETYALAIICCGQNYDEKRRGVELINNLISDPLIPPQWKQEAKTQCQNLIGHAGGEEDNRLLQEISGIPI